jgi:hypothetical protein
LQLPVRLPEDKHFTCREDSQKVNIAITDNITRRKNISIPGKITKVNHYQKITLFITGKITRRKNIAVTGNITKS